MPKASAQTPAGNGENVCPRRRRGKWLKRKVLTFPHRIQ